MHVHKTDTSLSTFSKCFTQFCTFLQLPHLGRQRAVVLLGQLEQLLAVSQLLVLWGLYPHNSHTLLKHQNCQVRSQVYNAAVYILMIHDITLKERSLFSHKYGFFVAFTCPRRPNIGREGRPIGLRANHFQITMPRGYVHHYDINIQPDKCPRKVNREIIETMVHAYTKIFGTLKPVFDGRNNLYTRDPLPIGSDKLELEVSSRRSVRVSKRRAICNSHCTISFSFRRLHCLVRVKTEFLEWL